MQRKSSRDGSFFVFPLPIGIVQVIFFCLLMLLLQHPDGPFQLAWGSAALAGKGADRFGQAAAEQGVHPLAHGRNAIGPAGDRGQIGVLAPRLAALDPALFLQTVQKVEHRGRGPAGGGQLFADIPPGGRAGQSQTASSTCSSAAESGFSLSESPYTGFISDFLLLHLSHFSTIIPHPA